MLTLDGKRSKLETLVRSCRMIQKMNRNRPETAQSESLYYRMLEKYPKARYCMITVMDEEGGCFTDNAGAVSYLEYRGLGAYLHDLCDRCAADLAEQEDDDDEGEDNKP